MNYRIVDQMEVLDKHYYSNLKTCVPRPVLKKYVKPEVEEVRDPWEFPKSIFARYIQDHEELMNQLFEFDWALWGKPKFSEGK